MKESLKSTGIRQHRFWPATSTGGFDNERAWAADAAEAAQQAQEIAAEYGSAVLQPDMLPAGKCPWPCLLMSLQLINIENGMQLHLLAVASLPAAYACNTEKGKCKGPLAATVKCRREMSIKIVFALL